MNPPDAPISFELPTWVDSSLFKGMLRGIERESLRMQSNGFLSQAAHPQALGRTLTHPHITTDYAEALMEFITPPLDSIQKTLSFLRDIHTVVDQDLPEGEKLWPLSMPCMLDNDEESIVLAQYGQSNIGRFKTLYRRGLGVRYGRRMQTIAGVHYNVSFPDALFIALQQQETDPKLCELSLQDYRSHRYFALIRNFIRLTPLVIYLLGASPTVCRCFMTGREHHLLPLVKGTLFLPYATALRMGRFGYQNSAQKQLGIHYNSLEGYVSELQKAVYTPFPAFSRLGLDDEAGEPIQINDHVLQIENEYYSLVRPKQTPIDGETPSQALKNRGVGYVELRAVDVNPYDPIGIDEHTAAFLEVLASYCLLLDSPELLEAEQEQIERNQNEIVNRGRAPNAQIHQGEEKIAVVDWIQNKLDDMKAFAEVLDQSAADSIYSEALAEMIHRNQDAEATLSARVIKDTLTYGGTWNFGTHMAFEHCSDYETHKLQQEQVEYFSELAQNSIEQQDRLEQQQDLSFEGYLKAFRFNS